MTEDDEHAAFKAWWNASDNAFRAASMTWTLDACWFAWQAFRATLAAEIRNVLKANKT